MTDGASTVTMPNRIERGDLGRNRARGPAAVVSLLMAIVAGCDENTEAPPPASPVSWFDECAAERGLAFAHQSGHRETYLMPQIMGGGAALFDMDGDGDLDAYLVQSGSLDDQAAPQPGNQLFRNLGDGVFEDVSTGSGADDRGYGMGVATGDFDNDGDVDLYVTNVGPNVLLRNDGGGRFTDVTSTAGVGHAGWGASAVFLDYDNDGDLDLFVTNYLNWSAASEIDCLNSVTGTPDYCSPQSYRAPAVDVLYRNDGDGRFSDVTAASGIDQGVGTGLGVVAGDFNQDGWTDIFVANDGMRNQLWINQGDTTFVDQALLAGCALDYEGRPKAGMGVTAADIDDDGDLDLLVCNLDRQSDSFFMNQGNYFIDRTSVSGLAAVNRSFTRFGMAWLDFDNDGLLDLYQVNGRVRRDPRQFRPDDPFAEPNLLMRGVGSARFQEQLPRGGTEDLLVATSRAAAFGDIDNDGRIDILIVNRDAAAHLLRNITPDDGHWIMFRVVDLHGRDAIGATVTAMLPDRTIHRDVRTAYSYLAANDPRVHLGLGPHEKVQDVTVRWIDGTVERFGAQEADQIVTLRRGEGEPDP